MRGNNAAPRRAGQHLESPSMANASAADYAAAVSSVEPMLVARMAGLLLMVMYARTDVVSRSAGRNG